MAITPEQIIETAEALAERGESPTLAAVRRELGGGSYTTISEALKGWRERRQVSQARAEAVQVPARVQEALAQAGTLVWTEATRQHAAQLAAERAALDVERQRSEGERREAVELADQVSRDLDQVRGERDQALQAVAQERQGHDQARAEAREQRALADERGRHGEAQEAELRDLRRQAGESAGELGQLRGQLEALRGQVEDLRTMRTAIEGERDQARAALQEAQGEAQEQARRRQEQEAALDALRSQVAAAELEGTRLTGTLDRTQRDAAEAERRAVAAETQADRTAAALEASQAALATAERVAVELRLEVATLTERAAHSADLRAILATLQASAPPPDVPAAAVPELTLEPTPKPKAPTRRRGSAQQAKSGDQA
jgi:chromosome segregation ATPase